MKKLIIFAIAVFVIFFTSCKKDVKENVSAIVYDSYIVSTLAGNGQQGYIDGPGNVAQFKSLSGIVADAQGNIYVTDALNYVIRKITSSGLVTTFAGNGVQGFINGQANIARFNSPSHITIDFQGNLYVIDNYRIRKITPDGFVTTFAGGEAMGSINGADTAARFYAMSSITTDRQGNVFVKENGIPNGGILKMRKITPAGLVSTFIEDKILSTSLTSDKQNNIYLGGSYNDGSIYSYTPLGIRNTVKQMDGYIVSLVRDEQGNFFYTESGQFAFSWKHQIFKLSSDGKITAIAGTGVSGYTDGDANISKFNTPAEIALDAQGNIFVADIGNLRIRKIARK